MRGKFFCFEGNEKAGKTTASKAVTAWLNEQGYPTIRVRAPGETLLGLVLREIVLNKRIKVDRGPSIPTPIGDRRTTDLLHIADLRETATQVIEPALAKGINVITDRFEDSTRAYAVAHGAPRDLTEDVIAAALPRELLHEAIHIYFRLPVEVTMERIAAGGLQDAADGFDREFYARVAAEYERNRDVRSKIGQETWLEVDATKSQEAVLNLAKILVLNQLPALSKA